jgi:hypothetical protein
VTGSSETQKTVRSSAWPTCALLMLVTPPELPIAMFTIKALRKFQDISGLSIVIFANGLSAPEEELVRTHANAIRNACVVSNRNKIEKQKHEFTIGAEYISEHGRRELRVGPYESAPEVWERELPKLDADIVGIMDADFEVLSGDFLPLMIEAFCADDQLGFMSVDYSPETRTFDSYSQQVAAIAERHHTWFCLYLREALTKYADFSYFEQTRGGGILKFDHAARLQEVLKRTYNYHGAVLESKWRWTFVHYQAFAQNRTLTGGWLRVYRFLKIGAITGWFSVHRINYLIPPLKLISRILYGLLWLRRFDSERGRYRFEKT